MSEQEALKRALELAGGAKRVAASFGITHQAIYQWPKCPPCRVIGLESLTGGKVKRSELRPDLYPDERRRAS